MVLHGGDRVAHSFVAVGCDLTLFVVDQLGQSELLVAAGFGRASTFLDRIIRQMPSLEIRSIVLLRHVGVAERRAICRQGQINVLVREEASNPHLVSKGESMSGVKSRCSPKILWLIQML